MNYLRRPQIRPLLTLLAATIWFVLTSGCTSLPRHGSWSRQQAAALRDRLLQLGDTVDKGDAALLADTAVEQAATLARQYRVVRPAWLHNCLVNGGLRPRGLCYEWANDLYPRLHELGLRSLELHLAVACMDTPHEHNAIVVTAHRQPFREGVVLDAWRHSGRLWYGSSATDKYPWQPLPSDRVAPELQKLLAR
jgi:hypothetical protein